MTGIATCSACGVEDANSNQVDRVGQSDVWLCENCRDDAKKELG